MRVFQNREHHAKIVKLGRYEPNVFEEEDFLIFFMYFYGLNLGPPEAGPSSNLRSSFEQNW